MLKELWKFITNLGISNKLSPFDEKAVKLMNQLSFVMVLWFTIFSLFSLFDFDLLTFIISSSNVLLFFGVLVFNSYGKTTFAKNYLVIFGLAMVSFVNMAYDPSTFPMIQFITTAIFPVLIFKKKKTTLIYIGLNILFLFLILYYHNNHPPLIPLSASYPNTHPYIGVSIIMIVVFLISLFFRNVSDDLERKLVEKNRYLNDLIEKTQSMQEQLVNAEKMASLGQLTAGIAHEINNPINFVSSNLSPLKKDLAELKELCLRYNGLHSAKEPIKRLQEIEIQNQRIDPEFLYEEINTLIHGIEEGAERTKQIVLGLRNFSRLDEGVFKRVDIHEGLESTLMLLQNKIKNRITVVKNYEDLPPIECMPGKLNQVTMNILNNATEAIANEGEIIITTTFVKKKNKIQISIKDNGAGMSALTQRRIFEPFYTTKPVGKGTGLGLSISYGIIEKHGGLIELISELNKGSEFIITLPVKQTKKSR